MILEVQTEIKKLGATPLTENEAKYKGKLLDKYIKALQDQLAELKAEKKNKSEAKAKEEKEKAEAKKKSEKDKKEK